MQSSSLPRPWRLVLVGLLALHVGSAAADAQAVTGSIFGTVVDASGSRLPGATVTLRSEQLITGEIVRVTSPEGTYRFPTLPPGTYQVAFELQGFRSLRREGVVLLAGQSLGVDAQLPLADIAESITVTGESPLVDVRSSALVNTADSATLENIPIQREFTQILNIMPGVTDGRYDFSPVNNVHGSTLRQNVYSLDGVNTDDPITNATVTLLPPDAFQEVQVTTAGISAEFGDASGGVFNYITKSGGNTFSGGVNYYYQGRNLESDNLSSEVKATGLTAPAGFEHIHDAGGLLGGPLKRNRVWFFANYRYMDAAETRSDFAAPLTTEDTMAFVKSTVQVASQHKAEVSYYYRDFGNFPYTAVASFRNSGDPRVWMGVEKKTHIIIPRWTSVLSDRAMLEVRANSSLFQLAATNPNNDGSTAYIDSATGIFFGGDQHTFGDNRRDRHRVKADFSYFREQFLGGAHNFKAGVDWGYDPVFQERLFQGARGDNELFGCSSSCISDTPDTWHVLFNNEPFRVRLWNAPRLTYAEIKRWAGYVQDQWVIGDRVTLNIGVRIDHVNGSLPESRGGGGRWDPEVIFPREDGLITTTDVAPRLGFVWDVMGDRQTTVKGSAGRFYNQINTGYVSTVDPNGIGYREFDWADLNGNRVYQPGEEGILRLDTRPNPARRPQIDPNLRNMYTDVYTFGVERAILPNTSLAATAIIKRDGDVIGTVDAVVPFSAYTPLQVQNPVTNQPMTIYTLQTAFRGLRGQTVLTNPGERPGDPEKLERKYNGLEVVLRKRMHDNWQFEGSYVFGKGEGNVGNAFGDSFTADYTNPNVLINRYGELPMGPRHQFKMHGAVRAPYDVTLSGYFELLSGIPWTDTFFGSGSVKGSAITRYFQSAYPAMQSETFIDVAGEAAGTRNFDAQRRLDVRAEKRFRVGNQELSGALDVFNVFNQGTVIRIKDLLLGSPNFGLPAQVQAPRQARVSIRWIF
jgi:outer membrane receptor protein involved in Fe transport